MLTHTTAISIEYLYIAIGSKVVVHWKPYKCHFDSNKSPIYMYDATPIVEYPLLSFVVLIPTIKCYHTYVTALPWTLEMFVNLI